MVKKSTTSSTSVVQHSAEVRDARASTLYVAPSASGAIQEPLPSISYADDMLCASTAGTAGLSKPCSASPEASHRAAHVASSRFSTSYDVATLSTSTVHTIQAHLEPCFVSAETSRQMDAKVQAKLRSVPATALKIEQMRFSRMPSANGTPNQEFRFSWEQGLGWQHK